MPPSGVKAINRFLDNVAKQTEECRTQLASIISAQRLRECQGFVDKVSEIRFTKVRQRQLNKYNMLLNKKEGNITRAKAINLINNLASQSGRQAGTSFPLGKEAILPQQVVRQALSFPLGKEAVLPRQLLTFLLGKEAIHPQQVVRQVLSFPLGKEPVLPRHLLTFPQVKEAILPRQLLTFLLGEGNNSTPAIVHLPLGEGRSSPQAGQSNNQARSVRQGLRWSNRHRAPQASTENSTISQEDNLTTTPQ